MNKITKKIILFSGILIVLTASVIAFQVLFVATVAPFSTCTETDSFAVPFTQQFGIAGVMNGTFILGNQTFIGPFADRCLNNTTLIEFVCGSSVNSSFSNLAAALLVDCATLNSSTTRCVVDSVGDKCT